MNRLHFLRFYALVMAIVVATSPSFAFAKTVEELRAELDAKREALESTEAKIKEFKNTIQEKKKEARTLGDQIELIDDSIGDIELEIDKTVNEIDKTGSEIALVEEEVRLKEEDIVHQKDLLAELIRSIYSLDQQSTVTVMLKYETFSEAINESATLSELQNRGQETLVQIQQLHEELKTKERELKDFKQSLEDLQNRQESQQNTLETQRNSKERILDLTNEQEAQFQDLLQEATAAHKAAQAAIKQLDEQIREELRKQGTIDLGNIGSLDWPIPRTFGISCEFHCTGYPYAYLIGPHSAIDIPAHVGTPIRAPADGYIAKAYDSGNSNYSYILMVHGKDGSGANISTVYGHVSGFAGNEGEFVTRGTVIGYTGGASGSRGSGLSTGPHLHWEVRKDGTPVNPRQYVGG